MTAGLIGTLPVVVLAALTAACWIWPGSIGPVAALAIEGVAVFAASYLLGWLRARQIGEFRPEGTTP